MVRRIAWQWESAYKRLRLWLIPRRAAPLDAWLLHPDWPQASGHVTYRRDIVLYTIALVLLILWVLGLATSFTAGGLLHILLVVAVVAVLYQLITGRRAL
jgi:hypothetical protein